MISKKSRINDPSCEGEPCTSLLTDNTFASAASTYSPAGEPAWLYSSLAVDRRYLMQDGLLWTISIADDDGNDGGAMYM
jgi:hypothetical protein